MFKITKKLPSQLTIIALECRERYCSGAFIVDFEQILHLFEQVNVSWVKFSKCSKHRILTYLRTF